MNQSRNDARPWEEWHLSAYVLGELDPDMAKTISEAANSDDGLVAEIDAIRSALAQVALAIKSESQLTPARASFGESRWQRIIETANQLPVEAQSLLSDQPVPSSGRRSGKTLWLGLLGMAVSLLVAAWLSFPIVSDWMLASNQQPPSSTPTEEIVATIPSPSGTAVHSLLNDIYGEDSEATFSYEGKSPSGVALPVDGVMANDELAIVLGNTSSLASAIETTVRTRNEDLQESIPSSEMSVASSGLGVGGSMGGNGESAMMGGMDLSYEGMLAKNEDASGRSAGHPSSDAQGLGLDRGMMGAGGMGGSMGGGMVGKGGMGGGMGGMMSGKPGKGARDGYGDDFMTGDYGGGMGYGMFRGGGDHYAAIVENNFERVQDAPLSTLSIDVDTASYAKCRQLLMEANQLPPPAAVRLEEFINYFDYQYADPTDDAPVAAHLAVANCPWQPEHQLVRIALQSPKIELAQRPAANIVFLLDVSGSMDEPNKLPLVKEAMRMLIEQLGENDRLAMVVYAGAAGCVLESTRGDQQAEILAALDRLKAGGSTNGGDGIQLAYNLARDHYIPGGINRVILCTDGDFNVGVTNTQALVDLVVEQARGKTFLTVLGFGLGNTNDAMMEQISNRGNGVYAFVDSWREAKRQMVQQIVGNLMTVAKDVKLQVEFNPQKVEAYRLLGYENRVMAAQDFNDDKKDAGEIGAGHRVTALYEVIPLANRSSAGREPVDELRYQPKKVVGSVAKEASSKEEPVDTATIVAEAGDSSSREVDDSALLNRELLAVKLRYKQPEGEASQLRVFPLLDDESTSFAESDADFRWAASMAEFGMLLRSSRYGGQASWSGLIEQANAAAGAHPDMQREECLQMIRRAAQLHGQ